MAIVRRLRDAGHAAYFAGGCVRDMLLGLRPSDFDVATTATPKEVRSLFKVAQLVGAAFGVVIVRQGESVVEVATFRSEGVYEDGRRPASVTFSTPEADAQRRDFTINGLFYDPIEGRVIDYVDGQADLRARRLRAIGDPADRFREDHLRMLRAVRFASRFSLQVEPATEAAIRRDAPLLKRISPERIADELRRMLTAPTRDQAWAMLWDFGLLETVLRFLPAEPRAPLNPQRCPLTQLQGEAISFPLALAAGALSYRLHATSQPALDALLEARQRKDAVRALRQALRPSNDETDAMHEILASCESALTPAPSVAQLKRVLGRPAAIDAIRLLDALAAAGHGEQTIAAVRLQLALLAATDCAPPPLLTGDHLVAAGLQPGPAFKKILSEVYDAQLESRVTTASEAHELGLKLAKQLHSGHPS